jgi:hypothetical protein
MSMENHGGMISTRILLICPPQLSGNHTNSHPGAKQEEMVKEIINFALRGMSFILRRVF